MTPWQRPTGAKSGGHWRLRNWLVMRRSPVRIREAARTETGPDQGRYLGGTEAFSPRNAPVDDSWTIRGDMAAARKGTGTISRTATGWTVKVTIPATSTAPARRVS